MSRFVGNFLSRFLAAVFSSMRWVYFLPGFAGFPVNVATLLVVSLLTVPWLIPSVTDSHGKRKMETNQRREQSQVCQERGGGGRKVEKDVYNIYSQ